MRRLLAIDPSLTCSGWALFELPPLALEAKLQGVGQMKSKPPSLPLATRLDDLQSRIGSLLKNLKLSQADILICEAPTTMRDPRAAFKVEQVRCIFETMARSFGLNVPGRLNPRTVQQEVLGLKGRQVERLSVKAAAVQVVSSLYSRELEALGFGISVENLRRHQDIVDAILLGRLGASRVQSAIIAGLSLEGMFMPRLNRDNGRRLSR